MSFSGTLMSDDSASDADHSDIENPCDVDDLSDIEKPSDVENHSDVENNADNDSGLDDHMNVNGDSRAYGYVSDSDSRMEKFLFKQARDEALEEEDNRSTDSFTNMFGERQGPFYSDSDLVGSESDFYGDHHANSPSLTDSEFYDGGSQSGYFDSNGEIDEENPVHNLDEELPDGRYVTFDRNSRGAQVGTGQTVLRDPENGRSLEYGIESRWSLPSEEVSAVHIICGREIHVLQQCITDVHHKVYHDVYDRILASVTIDKNSLAVLKLNGELDLFTVGNDQPLEFMSRLRVDIPDGLTSQSFNRPSNELLVPTAEQDRVVVCAAIGTDTSAVRVYDRCWPRRRLCLEPKGIVILDSTSKITLYGNYLWELSKEGSSVRVSVFKTSPQSNSVAKRLYTQIIPGIKLSSYEKVPQPVALSSSRKWKSLFDIIVLTAKPVLVSMEIRDDTVKTKFNTLELPEEFKTLPLNFRPEKLYLRTTSKVFLLDNASLTVSPITSLLDNAKLDNRWFVANNTAKPFPVFPKIHNILVGTPTDATINGEKEHGVFGPGLHGWGTTPLVVQRGRRLEIIQEALTLKSFGGLAVSESDKWPPSAISKLIWVRKARLLFIMSESKTSVFTFKRNTRRGFQSNVLYPRKIDGLDSIEVVTAGVVLSYRHSEDGVLLIVGLREVLAVSPESLKFIGSKKFDGTVTSAAVDSFGAYVILNGGQSVQSVDEMLKVEELRQGISPQAYFKTLRGLTSLILPEGIIDVHSWLKKDIVQEQDWAYIPAAPLLDVIASSGPHRPMVGLYRDNTVDLQTGDFSPLYRFRQQVQIVGYVAESTSNYYQGAVLLSEDRLWFASKDRMVPLAVPAGHGRVHTACVVKDTIIAVCEAGIMMYVPEFGRWSPTPMPVVTASVDLPDERTTNVIPVNVENANVTDDDDDDDHYKHDFNYRTGEFEASCNMWDEGDVPRRLLHVKSRNLILALRSGTYPMAYDFTSLRPLIVVGGTVKSRAAILWEYSDREGVQHEYLLMTARRGFDRYEIYRSGDNVELRPVPISCRFDGFSVPHHIYAIGSHVIYGDDTSAAVVDFSSGDGRMISSSIDIETQWAFGCPEGICWNLTHVWKEFVLATSNGTIDIVKADFDNSPDEFRFIRSSHYFTYQHASPRRPDLAMDRVVRGEHEGIAFAIAAIDRGLFVVTIDTQAQPPDLAVHRTRFFRRLPAEYRDSEQSFITRLRLCPPIRGSKAIRIFALRSDSSIVPFVVELATRSPEMGCPQPFFF